MAVSLAIIAFFTLRPAESPIGLPAYCIICGPLGGVDFVLNIVLFVPLGAGLFWLTGRWGTSTIIGAATTLIIEALQWRVITGRDASVGDLLANTAGTLLGTWLAVATIRWVNANQVAARHLAEATGVLIASVIAASAWLLQPVAPQYPTFVQWTPIRPNMDPFRGRLVGVDVNGREIHRLEVLPPQKIVDSVTRSVSVRAVIAAPVPASRRTAIIVRTANTLEEGLFLAQRGEAIVFRTTLNATRLKLRSILFGLDSALVLSNTVNADSADLVIEAGNSAGTMSLSTSGTEREMILPRTIGLGWALLLPWDISLDGAWWPANALWLAILVAPIGFFTVRSSRTADVSARPRVTWWPMALVLVTIVAMPAAMGMSSLRPGEWAGVAAGIVTAIVIERLTSPTHGEAMLANAQGASTS